MPKALNSSFFNRYPIKVAENLLGKVIRVMHNNMCLSAMIVETEAYYRSEKASHASLGFTEKRKALFMAPGTIYMYYARGGDSFNVSCRGEGNGVLIKAGMPYFDDKSPIGTLRMMQQLNPRKNNSTPRDEHKLCSGQTLLCRALGLKVPDWNQQCFDSENFYMEDVAYYPNKIIQARRLGIPKGRDEHLLYRFIDYEHVNSCTENPLRKKAYRLNQDYFVYS